MDMCSNVCLYLPTRAVQRPRTETPALVEPSRTEQATGNTTRTNSFGPAAVYNAICHQKIGFGRVLPVLVKIGFPGEPPL